MEEDGVEGVRLVERVRAQEDRTVVCLQRTKLGKAQASEPPRDTGGGTSVGGYIYEYDKEGRMVNVYPAGEERVPDPAAPPVYRGLDEFLGGEESVGTKEVEKVGEGEADEAE